MLKRNVSVWLYVWEGGLGLEEDGDHFTDNGNLVIFLDERGRAVVATEAGRGVLSRFGMFDLHLDGKMTSLIRLENAMIAFV